MEEHVQVIGDDEHIIQIGHWAQQFFQQFHLWILHWQGNLTNEGRGEDLNRKILIIYLFPQ
jgi:hypothetical protein